MPYAFMLPGSDPSYSDTGDDPAHFTHSHSTYYSSQCLEKVIHRMDACTREQGLFCCVNFVTNCSSGSGLFWQESHVVVLAMYAVFMEMERIRKKTLDTWTCTTSKLRNALAIPIWRCIGCFNDEIWRAILDLSCFCLFVLWFWTNNH